MTLFGFKDNSILNNGFARGVNLVVWVIIFAVCIFGDYILKFPAWRILTTAASTGILTAFCLERVIKTTTFYEWDYTERQKKSRFIVMYVMFCSTIWTCVLINAFLIYDAFTASELHWFIRSLPVASFCFFVFNILNIPSLFYPAFKDDLNTAYKVQKKPDNWQDDGPEINNDDEVAEIMRRDWGV